MSIKPTFSVIVPVYNVEVYLDECINSIINQSYRNFEVILINDGSTDDSLDICKKYSLIDDRVKVFDKKNSGLSDTRNAGLLEAEGNYIFFIDSDDFLLDLEALNKLNSKIIDSSFDVVFFKFNKFKDFNKKMLPCHYSIPENIYEDVSRWLVEMNRVDAFYNSAWSKIVSRDLLIRHDIKFKPGLLGEDNHWFYSVVLHSTNYSFIDQPFIAYRQRIGSITKSYTLKNMTDLIYIIEYWVKANMSIKNREIIYASLAKQFCHALIGYSKVKDVQKEKYLYFFEECIFLLDFSENKRVKMFKFLHMLLGLKLLISVVKVVDKYKNKGIH